MKVTAIAPWFGSKRVLAQRIVEQLGPHRAYWEPFCGSMAVLLAKPPCPFESVCDLHGDLINLARVIKDRVLGPQLFRRLRRVLFADDLANDARAALGPNVYTIANGPDLDRAEQYFISSWQGMNGMSGTAVHSGSFAKRFSSTGGSGSTRWRAAVGSIPSWRRRLANVDILNDDGFEVISKIEDLQGTVIYADPPYLKKGAAYIHDFAPADHERLAAALCRFKETRCVVSYYDHAALTGLYPGWAKIECTVAKALVQQGRRGKDGRVDAPEVLLVNGPKIGSAAGLFD